MGSSLGKRQRERQKSEKAKVKADRKAARKATDLEPTDLAPDLSEPQLIEDLAALYRAFEAGDVSPEEFEDRRDQLQAQFERLSQ